MLISIVGADGAGKSSLTKCLNERFQQDGRNTHLVDRWDILRNDLVPSARFVKKDLKLLRACVEEMPLSARFRFLTWSMAISLDSAMVKAGKEGVLIYDSYWHKHAAVEIVYGAESSLILSMVESLPQADLIIYLKADPQLTLSRIRKNLVPYECGMDPECQDVSFLKHQNRIIDLLDTWSDKENWCCLDASLSMEQLVERAISHWHQCR